MNKVMLEGRITLELEMKKTKTGKDYLFNVLAVKRSYDNETDFIPFTCYGNVAKNLIKYTQKGARIILEGNIRSSELVKDGIKENKIGIIAEKIYYIDYRKTEPIETHELRAEDIPF